MPISTDILKSTIGTGTAPLTVSSTTKVTNLNSDLFSDKLVTEFLTSVSLGTPTLNDIIRYNGVSWTNFPFSLPSSASSGINFFLDDTAILPANTENSNEVNTLNHFPVTTAEVVDSVVVNNNTVLKEAYLYNTGLGGNQIDPGVWVFSVWAGVDNTAGTSQLLINTYRVIDTTGMTVAMTGSGTTRLATVTGGTPFIAGDGNVVISDCSYLQTPKGLYAINSFSTTSEVTITTPSAYVNESGVSFKIWRKLFQVATGDINSVSPNYSIFNMTTAQGSFAISSLDELGSIFFGTTTRTSNTTISFTHNGTSRYSYFTSPLLTRHNDLAALQGGTSGQYYHLTSAAYGYLQNQNQSVYTSSNVTFASATLSNLSVSSLVGSDAAKKLITITALPTGTTCSTPTSASQVVNKSYADALPGANIFDKNTTVIFPIVAGNGLNIGPSGKVTAQELYIPVSSYYQDSTFYALLTSSIDANFGFDGLTGTATGGAAIAAGYLDLAHDDLRYLDYVATKNADFTQKGTIRIHFKPNYTGTPATDQYIFSLTNGSTITNRIELFHKAGTGGISLVITDSTGSNIMSVSLATWSPTSGTNYVYELNVDITNGSTKLYRGGSQIGSTQTGTGTRTNTCTIFRLGSNYDGTTTSNMSLRYPIVYNTSTSTAGAFYTLSDSFTKINNTASRLIGSLNILSGNVGIGNTNSRGRLDISTEGSSGETQYIYIGCSNTTTNSSGGINWAGNFGSYTKFSASVRAICEGNFFRQGLGFLTGNDADGTTDAIERMRITMNGGVAIGATAATGGKLRVVYDAAKDNTYHDRCLRLEGGRSGYAQIFADGNDTGAYLSTTGSDGTKFALYCVSNSVINFQVMDNGNIIANGVYDDIVGATNRDLYIDNTGLLGYVSSSIRFKEEVIDIGDISWLYTVRPVNFIYKNDSSRTVQAGLIAEDLLLINPSLVSYEQEQTRQAETYNEDGTVRDYKIIYIDKLDENGNKIPESIQYSKFIPYLIKSVQDLNSRLLSLEKPA